MGCEAGGSCGDSLSSYLEQSVVAAVVMVAVVVVVVEAGVGMIMAVVIRTLK